MAHERLPGTDGVLGESQTPRVTSHPKSFDVADVGVGNAEDLQLPPERRFANALMEKLLVFMEAGPRRLVRPLAEELRGRLSSQTHAFYLNGSLPMDSLPTYRDDEGDWKVIHEARSTRKPGLILCVLIKPENITEGKFIKVAPKGEIAAYLKEQRNEIPEQVPAVSGAR